MTLDLTVLPRLWVPGQVPGMNEIIAARSTVIWRRGKTRVDAYTRMKQEWGAAIVALSSEARYPHHQSGYVNMFCFERDQRRDFDNIVSGASKLILDGMVSAGLLPGDGRKVILGVGSWVGVDKKTPGVCVVISQGRRADTAEAEAFMSWWLGRRAA